MYAIAFLHFFNIEEGKNQPKDSMKEINKSVLNVDKTDISSNDLLIFKVKLKCLKEFLLILEERNGDNSNMQNSNRIKILLRQIK